MSEWKPIETAPKYEDVLVYEADIETVSIAHFNGKFWIGDDNMKLEASAFTHWMPLPAPPGSGDSHP